MNHSDFVRKYSFDNPLQRLVMLRILMGGSMDGEGERVIDHRYFTNSVAAQSRQCLRRSRPLNVQVS